MVNNCMFQFYDGNKMVDDTGLITIEQALGLFDGRKSRFASSMASGRDCEMAIWFDCAHDADYRKTLKRWHSDDVKFDGKNFLVKE